MKTLLVILLSWSTFSVSAEIPIIKVVAQQQDCVVFTLDEEGNSHLDKYLSDNPNSTQVPVRDILDESTLRAFGNYNKGSQFIALCSPAVKAYHPKSRHCVDRKPYESNDAYGKWVCSYEERLKSKWSNGNWSADGDFVPYDEP